MLERDGEARIEEEVGPFDSCGRNGAFLRNYFFFSSPPSFLFPSLAQFSLSSMRKRERDKSIQIDYHSHDNVSRAIHTSSPSLSSQKGSNIFSPIITKEERNVNSC